ncbi:protein aurora borealis [Agrilus planipennis]|uniref:Protein aurora borealis n=1 Tax=Agrilus planipennis TaxID=224129 RepID=A0A7F5RNI2_AGRPL|nr:protein aurora borealis [Agrilus planipennis]
MDSHDSNGKGTPSEDIHNILRDTVQPKFSQSNYCCDSPFKWLPHVSTPPSRFFKIKNPFETHLTERLHTTVFSPSVFNKEPSPKIDTFKWTIEEISNLKPADIDETTINQFSPEMDPILEETAQSKIEKFFSKKEIVPSPMDNIVKTEPLISEDASPPTVEETKQFVNGASQTVLTLPPILPASVETALKPYFSYTIDQQENANFMLYKQLFEYNEHENIQSPSQSIQSSPAPSCQMSPIQFSPYEKNQTREGLFRRCESLEHISPLRDCDLSPISSSPNNKEVTRGQSRSLHSNNYSCHMSVDTSINLVPDTADELPPNQSLAFESAHSFFNNEVLSDSTVNWDMEYKHVSLESLTKSPVRGSDRMDVSNTNTPRSKIFTSQRKKLSESFLLTELTGENEENKENVFYEIKAATSTRSCSITTKTSLFSRDITDAGYHTGLHTMSEEGSWNCSSALFASTPTKNKH